jgi:metallo-beta-lactamase class B
MKKFPSIYGEFAKKITILQALMLFLMFHCLSIRAQAASDSATTMRSVEFVKMTDGVWRHISHVWYMGEPVPSNGLVIEAENELLMVDTPCNDQQTDSLLRWADKTLHKPFRKVIATHAHGDRVGGLATLQKHGIDVWTTPLTGEWSVKRGFGAPSKAILPNDTTFRFGKFTVRVFFPGAGHTVDNIVVWIAEPRIVVGGCLIKTAETQSVGFIGDAVLNEWSNSVRKVGEQFSTASVVVPGHGEPGDKGLFQHTIDIIEKHLKQRPNKK